MKIHRNRLTHAVAVALLGAGLGAVSVPALSQHPGGGGRHHEMTAGEREKMRALMQERVKARTERLGTRLEIKASQQDAWNTFASSIQSMFDGMPQRPARDADAATVARFRADLATQRAQKLSVVADATARLQQVLDPNQRKVLDEAARRFGGGHRGHGPRHGRPGGGHRGGGHQGPMTEMAPEVPSGSTPG